MIIPNSAFRISDSIEECSHADDPPILVVESSECIRSLLHSLHQIAQGTGITLDQAKMMNTLFDKLTDADYEGPTAYDGTVRLPKAYTESLMKKEEDKENNQDNNSKQDESDSGKYETANEEEESEDKDKDEEKDKDKDENEDKPKDKDEDKDNDKEQGESEDKGNPKEEDKEGSQDEDEDDEEDEAVSEGTEGPS